VSCLTLAALGMIIGTALVVDRDTLHIDGYCIRLAGIDAPERGQQCERGGTRYGCGTEATTYLGGLIGDRTVGCKVAGGIATRM
jgi:endonuclease YncB( thermonuclease family)